MLLLLFLACSLFAAGKKPVTLEDAAGTGSGRRAGGGAAVWSPDGKRWVTQRAGGIKLYEIAALKETDIVETKALSDAAKAPSEPDAFAWVNRGVREQSMQWFPDNRRLLVAFKGDLFIVDVDAKKWEQITRTSDAKHDPKVSPDGRKIGFRIQHDLFVMDAATRKTARLTNDGTALHRNAELDWVYPEELALSTAWWWSPDSRRIAYLQFDLSPIMTYPHADLLKVRPVAEPERYPQAGTPNPNVKLGLIAAAGGKTKWVDLGPPAESLIGRVDWLPDSTAVAVHLLNRVQNHLAVIVSDGGKPKTILEENDAAWVNLKDDYRFLSKTRRFLRGSELNDYRHLYFHPLDGGEPLAITKGAWEVSDLACVDEARERLFYVSTEVSPLERHLYSVNFDGSGARRITSAKGTHAISMAPDCSHYLDSHSSITEPARRSLHDADAKELAVIQQRVEVQYDLLPTDFIQFSAKDGAVFHARLIKPAGFDPNRKYPAIVEVYGGPHAQTVRDSWTGASWDQALAQRGFVIWQMDGRGSAGRGHAWEAKLYRRFGAQELADQIEGVRHLVSLGFVDPNRVGINGWSYGGYMTLYSLFNAPGTFKAGVSGAPVTDWREYDTIYTERYLGLPQQNEEGYKASSAITYAANLKGKLMLVHNFEDDNVLFQHTMRMMDALQRAGKQFEFMLYPQKAHGVTGPVRKQMLEGMTAFFEKNLQ